MFFERSGDSDLILLRFQPGLRPSLRSYLNIFCNKKNNNLLWNKLGSFVFGSVAQCGFALLPPRVLNSSRLVKPMNVASR